MIRYISRCKENIALGAIMSKFEYLKLADTVAAEIANGALKPGDRLPPQRSFAYERKIAVSTASRVYTELLRRGLVVGEVGRGTFVSGETRRGIAMPTEPRGARIDLEVNYPMLPTQSVMIARSLAGLERPEVLDLALRHSTSDGHAGGTDHFRRVSLPRGLVPGPRAARLHRQRQAMHRGGAGGGGAERRPLRRRGADLSLHQGHRRQARRHAGAACDGRTRRSSGRGAEGAPRSASVGAVHSADDSKSARHDHAGGAPRRPAARRREARPHRHRGHGLWLSRRRNADWPRSRPTAASCSTACRRRWRPALRSASSFRRRACASASWPRFARADGRRPDLPLPPDNG